MGTSSHALAHMHLTKVSRLLSAFGSLAIVRRAGELTEKGSKEIEAVSHVLSKIYFMASVDEAKKLVMNWIG